jgi:hypothetical protein
VHRALTVAAILCIWACVPASAGAVHARVRAVSALPGTEQSPAGAPPPARLTVSFAPERLGAGTTVHLGFQIATPAGRAPTPLSEVQVLYPAELGIGTSSLGLENCSLSRLQAEGLAGCPANSLMGYGGALVEVPFETGPVLEHAQLTLVSGPVQEGHLGLLFLASGAYPVLAEFIFPGFVLPVGAPFGGSLDTSLPPIPSVPGGPDAAVIAMHTTIGPSHITYHERVHGRVVSFHPQGILLPASCPHGGFLFVLHLIFQDGTEADASTAVPCPRARRRG